MRISPFIRPFIISSSRSCSKRSILRQYHHHQAAVASSPSAPCFNHGSSRRAMSSAGGGSGDDSAIFGQPLVVEPWPFNSVMLDTDHVQVADTSELSTRLLVTLKKLREQNKNSIWVKVHLLNGHLLSVLGTFGFRLHHSEPEYAILNLWLGHPSHNKIPDYATHLVGVAGFVLNQKKEVLLVREGSKQLAGWKLPGGYVNLGEELGAAACREVEEETGVKCEFKSILSFRHQHNVSFGRSDIYVVTRLNALTEAIAIDNHEIQDARWVPLSQFRREASHPILKTVAALTKGIDEGGVDTVNQPGSQEIIETEHSSIIPGRPNFKLYHTPLST